MANALEVYTWEANANLGNPPLCLHEKQVPFEVEVVTCRTGAGPAWNDAGYAQLEDYRRPA